MNTVLSVESLPAPNELLAFGEVALRFVQIFPGDTARGFVPYYHFRIITVDGTDVGHINFRAGNTEHVLTCAGHIGYEVAERFRGRHYAMQACRAIAPLVRSFYEAVTITSDPDNHASIRTIERLGACFVDEIAVPAHDPHYQRGSRSKRRYQWKP
jgi:tagatose 1,6-diphosphate aldolase